MPNLTSSDLAHLRKSSAAKQLPGNLALRRRATSNMRAGDSVSQNRRAIIDPKLFRVEFYVNIKTPNPLNTLKHWRHTSKIRREQRAATASAMAGDSLPPLPVVVSLARLSSRTVDSDATPACLKSIRDSIADAYGVDDGDPRYRWEYAQERSKTYGVRVEIRAVQE